jgi:hypothetical protein
LAHVIPPFLIELRQAVEFRVELFVFPLLVLDAWLGLLHLERGIAFQLLLD